MKKLTFILLAVAGSMAFVGCSSDDDKGGGQDCFNCSTLGIETKFCKVGDNKYSISIAGTPAQELPLGDQTWEEFKASTLETCN